MRWPLRVSSDARFGSSGGLHLSGVFMLVSGSRRWWMRCVLTLSGLTVFGSAVPLSATLQYYDPFLTGSSPAAGEYAVGPIDGQNPIVGPTPFLTGAWQSEALSINGVIQANGLSYLGAPALGGSQVANPNSRQRRLLSDPWTSSTTATYYLSFIVNFGTGDYSDGFQGNDMGYRAVEFWDDAGAFAMNIAYNTFSSTIGPEQQDPRTGRMYVDLNGIHTIIPNSPPSFSNDSVSHLIVLRYDLNSGALSDSVRLYFDPKTTSEPELSDVLVTNIDFTLGALGGVTIFGGSGTFPTYDELRIGDTFAAAVPELPVPGDTNGDKKVDLEDYTAITGHFNLSGQTTVTGDVAGADGTQGSDGRVDLRDYRLWRNNRTDLAGAGLGSSTSESVPEPGTFLLFGIGAFVVAIGRKWR